MVQKTPGSRLTCNRQAERRFTEGDGPTLTLPENRTSWASRSFYHEGEPRITTTLGGLGVSLTRRPRLSISTGIIQNEVIIGGFNDHSGETDGRDKTAPRRGGARVRGLGVISTRISRRDFQTGGVPGSWTHGGPVSGKLALERRSHTEGGRDTIVEVSPRIVELGYKAGSRYRKRQHTVYLVVDKNNKVNER